LPRSTKSNRKKAQQIVEQGLHTSDATIQQCITSVPSAISNSP
jgi:hypothetical protein